MVDRRSRIPAYEQVADAIRMTIATERPIPGSRLPSAVDMAHQYDVGVDTIRKAIGILQSEGLVESTAERRYVIRERPVKVERRIARGARIRLRMPTWEERREHDIPERVPVAEVTLADGTVTLYVGDRDELTT